MLIGDKEIKPINDAAAKYLFTVGKYELICKSFANAVLCDLKFDPIPDFTLTSPVFSPVTYEAKSTYFDVQGRTSKFDQLDFEIQRRNHVGFPIRLISNLSRMFQNIPDGTKYGSYPRFLLIGLLNFNFDIGPKINGFHDYTTYLSPFNAGRCLSSLVQIHTLEIHKWEKLHKRIKGSLSLEDLKDFAPIDFWMAFFSDKTTSNEVELMASQIAAIDLAYTKLNQFAQNTEYLKAYDEAEEAARIKEAEIEFAVNEAVNEAVKNKNAEIESAVNEAVKNKEAEIESAVNEAVKNKEAEIESAVNERDCEIAREMLRNNLPIDTIAKILHLKLEQIKKIQCTL